MKRAIVSIVVIVLALALALGGCRNSEQKADDAATQTIAPAKPQPDLTGSDAMTQTVDVEKGRSENEGHGTEAAAAPPASTTTTTTATTTTITTTT